MTINGSASYSGSTCVSQGVLAIAPGGSSEQYVQHHGLSRHALATDQQRQQPVVQFGKHLACRRRRSTFYGNGSTTSGGQIAGNLLLGAGQNTITATCLTGTNQPWIRFASLPASPTIGATVNFSTTNAQVQLSTSAGLSNGILGGYAYFNGQDFATLSGGTDRSLLQLRHR